MQTLADSLILVLSSVHDSVPVTAIPNGFVQIYCQNQSSFSTIDDSDIMLCKNSLADSSVHSPVLSIVCGVQFSSDSLQCYGDSFWCTQKIAN